jgi:hypothetical protein
MTCPNCGGKILGDGYTVVLHCEMVQDLPEVAPDSDPIFCTPCKDYRPDHNGECLNCDEPASEHPEAA